MQHIDNPKGYANGKDARKVDPRLRGPIDPEELEIDPKTGMKNYIANESGTWDTSTAEIQRALYECVTQGRLAFQTGDKTARYEAYRLLGSGVRSFFRSLEV